MKIKVGVIFGGESVEHEISIISANQAMHALNSEKYEVVPIYMSKTRRFYSHMDFFNVATFKNLKNIPNQYPEMTFIRKDNKIIMEHVVKKMFDKYQQEVDLFIPVVHGTNGEDGSIQGYLEMLKATYAGCDVIAAGVGQDKIQMKHILENSGLPVVEWFWFYQNDYLENAPKYQQQAEKIGYPLIIKPACLGSSVGISKVDTLEEFDQGVKEALQYDHKILVERAIVDLREVNCSVLGDYTQAKASVIEEVSKTEKILSYQDKYQNGGKKSGGMVNTSRIIPAPLEEKQTKQIQEDALKTFRVLGTSGISRIDFLIDDQTNKHYVNEINTIPGSLSFYLWEPLGISFSDIMEALVKQAIDRQRRRSTQIFSYDTNVLENFGGSKGSKLTK